MEGRAREAMVWKNHEDHDETTTGGIGAPKHLAKLDLVGAGAFHT